MRSLTFTEDGAGDLVLSLFYTAVFVGHVFVGAAVTSSSVVVVM